VIAGLFMLGANSPVHAFFYALPLGKSFRGPWQMLFVYQFLVSVLAGIGIQAILERLRGARPGGWFPGTVAAGLALLVIGDVYGRTRLTVPPPVTAEQTGDGPAGLIEFLQSRPGRERVFIQAAGWRPPISKIGMMHRIFALPDYESNMPLVYQQFLTGGTMAMWQGGLNIVGHPRTLRHSRPRARSLDLMSVRYYAMAHPNAPEYSAALAGFTGGHAIRGDGYELFERRDALPRVYVVDRVLDEPTRDLALARVQNETFRPREEAVITGRRPEHSRLAPGSADGDVGRAHIVTYEPEEVEIAARCERPCLLVLTDLYFPGWRARVDDREVEIHEANALFRGVFLEPGTHRVTYRFAPTSFRNGLWLMLCAVAVSGIGMITMRRTETTARPAA
jgi:hypothetical protein